MAMTSIRARALRQPDPAELVRCAHEMIPRLQEERRKTRDARRVSDATIAAMADAGFFRVLQPGRWGGYEMRPETFYDIEIELARGDMSVGWVYGVLGVHPWLMGLMADRAAQDVWGESEDTRMCSSLIPVGRAKAVTDGFELEGHWRFSSGCHHAQWAILGGIVSYEPSGTPDVRSFLVPSSDYGIKDDAWHVGGLNGTGSEDIVVEKAFVPSHRTAQFPRRENRLVTESPLRTGRRQGSALGRKHKHGRKSSCP